MAAKGKAGVEPTTQPRDLSYWMGRVDTTLLEIRNLFEQYVKVNEQNWIDEKDWRKTVDNALEALDHRLTALEQRFLGPKPGGDETGEVGKTAITWRWLVEKAIVPVITAVIIFILLEVVPHVAGAK